MLNRASQSLALSYLLLLAACVGSDSGSRVLYSSSLETLDSILTEEGVEIDAETTYGPGASLRIEARGPRIVRLTEIRETIESGGELAFRGHVRTRNLSGQAYLELTVSVPGGGIRSSAAEPSRGSTDWVTQRSRLVLPSDTSFEMVGLNVVLEGTGTVWVDNIILVHSSG